MLLLGGCSAGDPQEKYAPFEARLDEQLNQSLALNGQYRKQVSALEGDRVAASDTLYLSMPQVEFGTDSTRPQLRQDLVYAFSPNARDSVLMPYLDYTSKGDTLLASRKPEAERQTGLVLQKIVQAPDDGIIRYLESRIRKESWLYQLEVDIQTHFDSLGHYQSHQMRTLTTVSLLGQSFEATINGQMIYP